MIPKSEGKIIENLERNKIEMKPLSKDTLISVESYIITDFKTLKNPYEGHYLHFDTNVSKKIETRQFKKGDYLVSQNNLALNFFWKR